MMKKILSIFLGFFFVMSLTVGCTKKTENEQSSWPIVQTKYGSVRGINEDGITVFRGIPFAKPPVGDLRFAAPENADSWTETLDCSKFQNVPVQESDTSPYEQSEDCLYLNIWAPDNAQGKNLPVLVFIHGGGYSFGHASNPLYDGKRFAKDGVIQVNIAYRLNALGFMTISDGDDNISNLGTLDQIKALQWIKDNIASFGGDNNNITICGESAGAFSVSSMILSPLAKGLFDRAIMQSGNTLGQNVMMAESQGNLEFSTEHANKFAQTLDAVDENGQTSLEKLRKLPAEELSKGSYLSMDFTKPSPYHFFTTFDGKVLPENPYKALVDGQVNDVPILAGFNTDEGTMFIPGNTTEDDYKDLLNRTFGDKAQEVYDRYPVDSEHTATERARDIIRMGLRMGSDLFAEVLSERGKDVYFYNLDYSVPELDEKDLGTMHALDLPFVFDTLEAMTGWFSATQRDLDFKEDIHTYWLNFIKTGDPNNGDKVPAQWPKYNKQDKKILVLDEQFHEEQCPNYEDVDYFSKLSWGESPY